MDQLLTKYWFSSSHGLGIGVTAFSTEDAINLIKENALASSFGPLFESCRILHDVSELDQDHVIPNMGVIVNRGIWFPKSS